MFNTRILLIISIFFSFSNFKLKTKVYAFLFFKQPEYMQEAKKLLEANRYNLDATAFSHAKDAMDKFSDVSVLFSLNTNFMCSFYKFELFLLYM